MTKSKDKDGSEKASKKKVAQKTKNIKLAPGDNLFKENDRAESLYIIKRGQVRLFWKKDLDLLILGY